MDAALAKEAAKLYALPAGEFTTARNARAKKLKPGDAELAAAVAKLPKPSAAAAAVNRLARDQPSEVRELIQAGKRLRAAQERAVAGKGSPDDLQVAVAEHRAALDRVGREARRLGLSEPVLERVGRTIRAASIDPELQRLLERGVLAAEVETAGFGLDPALAVAAAGTRRPPARAKGSTRAKESVKERRAKERREAAEEELRAAREAGRLAEAELRRARQAAAAAQRRIEKAETAVERAGRST